MKRYILVIIVLIVVWYSAKTFAYKQQWFTQFQENTVEGTTSFRCTSQCIVLLWDIKEWDIITVNGDISWIWKMWYWYLVGNAVYPAFMNDISPSSEYRWVLSENQIYAQVPKDSWTQVVLLFQWDISSDNMFMSFDLKTLWDSRDWFWKLENIAPYSINLRYWPVWGTWSWPKFAFFLTILLVVIYLISRKKLTFKKAVFGAIIIACIVHIVWWMRLLVDHIKITSNWIKSYDNNMTYFELRDYIPVTQKIRSYLDLDNVDKWNNKKCNIYISANQVWPYVSHRQTVYLRPCVSVLTWELADYELYYNIPSIPIGNKNILLTWDSFILIQK